MNGFAPLLVLVWVMNLSGGNFEIESVKLKCRN